MEILTSLFGLPVLKMLGLPLVKSAAMALTPVVAVYILGLFRGSAPYKGLRSALGKFSENLGHSISRIGNSKLKGFYEPIESVLIDFLLFMAEQMAVGLRKDNKEKLYDQAERLSGVESETRLKGILEKIREAKIDPKIEADPVKQFADSFGKQSIANKLEL